jgi:hypothetical protein
MSAPGYHYDYKPQGDVLEQYILEQSRRVFIMGPLGSGKTNASCWKLFRLICGQEPDKNGVRKSRWAAIRNTYPDLLGTTAKDWLEMFGDLGRFIKGGLEPPTHHLAFRLDDGTVVNSEVIFMALDRAEHVRKLRGTQLTGAWLNETKELPFAVIEMVDLRVGRYPMEVDPTWFGIFGDTNAPDTDHWYYRLAEVDKPEGWVFLRQPGGLIRDGAGAPWRFNPLAENVNNLPPRGEGWRYYVEGAQGKKEDWIKVNLANDYGYVMDGKPVYPDYSDSVHCQPFDLVSAWGIHIGLDFGLTPAALFSQRAPWGQWRHRFELCTESTGIIRFAGELKRFIAMHLPGVPILSITGDPAGDQRQAADNEERTSFQLLLANGVAAQPAFTNDFSVRTEAFAKPMRELIDGKPAFLIHPDCKVTRKGLAGGYCFRRMKVAGDERYRDEPDKTMYSHPCEAGQYLVMGAGDGAKVIAAPSGPKGDAERFRKLQGHA